MKKFDIEGNGKNIEVSDQVYKTLLNHFVENCYSLAKSYIVNHSSGLADFNHELFGKDIGIIRKQFTGFINEVEDNNLQNHLEKLFAILELLIDIDESIICAYKKNIFTNQEEEISEKNLKKYVFRSIYQQHNSPPEIVIQFAKDSSKQIPELEYQYNLIRKKIT